MNIFYLDHNPASRMRININDHIEVDLTPEGLKLFKGREEDITLLDSGLYRVQLWILIEVLGDAKFSMSSPKYIVDNTIYI